MEKFFYNENENSDSESEIPYIKILFFLRF